MTQLLEQVLGQAAQLPDEAQDSLAMLLLEEMEAERRWDESFARSADKLAQLAQAALAEHHAGKTRRLDPDKL